jgi:hypothetical protein
MALLAKASVAIDGSKFKAVSNREAATAACPFVLAHSDSDKIGRSVPWVDRAGESKCANGHTNMSRTRQAPANAATGSTPLMRFLPRHYQVKIVRHDPTH